MGSLAPQQGRRSYFQSDGGGKTNEPEQRLKDYPGRPVLDDRERAVLRAFIDAMDSKQGCSPPSGCVIPEDVQPHIPHAVEAVKEIGEGSFRKGVNDGRNAVIDIISFVRNMKSGKWKIIFTIFSFLVLGALGLIYLGFIQKLKQGGM